jgi:hypothetical protein
MPAEPKTRPTKESVSAFIDSLPDEGKRTDSKALLSLFKKITGEKPVMWGRAIVGFGTYQGSTGTWMLTGFSPRKGDLALYIMSGFGGQGDLLDRLGRHKRGKSCLYLKRLADIDMDVLRELVAWSAAEMKRRHPNSA